MNVTVTLKDIREQLSDLISRVAFGRETVVITKFGKPIVAVIKYDDYERMMNPHKSFSQNEWERGFQLMDKMGENTQKYPVKDVESAIDEAVREVRQQKKRG